MQVPRILDQPFKNNNMKTEGDINCIFLCLADFELYSFAPVRVVVVDGDVKFVTCNGICCDFLEI